jgi:hypothetical protein
VEVEPESELESELDETESEPQSELEPVEPEPVRETAGFGATMRRLLWGVSSRD